jgi:hypothetical protein
MLYGANSRHPRPWIRLYSVYEKIQVSFFFVQEIIISGVYISATLKLAKLQSPVRDPVRSRRFLHHLIAVNIMIIILDCVILGLEYANFYDIQTTYKSFAYSVKLKMEFSILNRLKEMATVRQDSISQSRHTTDMTSHATGSQPKSQGTNMDHLSRTGSCLRPRDPDEFFSAYAVGSNGYDHESHPQVLMSSSMGDLGVMKTTEICVQRHTRAELRGSSNSDNSVGTNTCRNSSTASLHVDMALKDP